METKKLNEILKNEASYAEAGRGMKLKFNRNNKNLVHIKVDNKKNLKYTRDQPELSGKTSRQSNFQPTGRQKNGFLQLEKSSTGPTSSPTELQEKIDRAMNY